MGKILLSALFLFNIATSIFAQKKNMPERIISLGPAITEQFFLLEAEDKLVGVTIYCTRPIEAQKKEKIGTVLDINLEKIVSLNPDLVLATSLTNPNSKKKLENLGIKTIDFNYAKNFSEICNQFLEIAKLVNKEEKAKKIIEEAKSKVNLIKNNSKNLSKKKVFFQLGTKPLFTITNDSFINDFIDFAGGINIATETKNGMYSREKAIKDNPDVIIITGMGIVNESEQEVWKEYKTINAVKNNKIVFIDPYITCSPNPITFAEGLEIILKTLHPEIVKK